MPTMVQIRSPELALRAGSFRRYQVRDSTDRRPRVLLLGYGGADNTGAEIRILTIIEDVLQAFRNDVNISVVTFNRQRTTSILGELAGKVSILEIPYVYPLALWRATRRFDLVMLVEGSTFKENWSSALLWMFLWGAWSAKRHGNSAIAYAVDAGPLSRFNSALTRHVCNGMDAILTRTEAAKNVLQEQGVRRPIEVTADTALEYIGQPDEDVARDEVGCAPVEFHEWPVRMRLWGPKEQLYHWPYYFSWDDSRKRSSAQLVDAWARTITHIVRRHGRPVRLIAMESLDRRICEKIKSALPDDVRARVKDCFAGMQSPQAIVSSLRKLAALVTSRYHASVLSMTHGVPQFALYHDERLASIYAELDLSEWTIRMDAPYLSERMIVMFDRLLEQEAEQKEQLLRGVREVLLPRCSRNRLHLEQWARMNAESMPEVQWSATN